jgi:vitamin B12 transporter
LKGQLQNLLLCSLLLLAGNSAFALDSLGIFLLDTSGVVGMKVLHPQPEQTTAGEAIRFAPGVFLRTTSAGGMQFVSAQGLNPQHLQLLWNGIPVNSGMLGMNDLSLFSVGYKQEVSYSTMRQDLAAGAIAGVVDIRTSVQDEAGYRISVKQSAGSFGQLANQLQHSGGKGQHAWAIRLNHEQAENDFVFNDYTVLPNVERRQIHGSFRRVNFTPSWQWSDKRGGVLQVISEHVYNHRHIPPTLVSPMFKATQEDKASRNMIKYIFAGDKISHEWSGAYVYNYWHYHDIVLNRAEENIEHLVFFRYQGEWKPIPSWKIFYGNDLKLTSVSTPNYSENKQEWGWDAHIGADWHPSEFWKLTYLSKISSRSSLPLYAPLSVELNHWVGRQRNLKWWLRAGTDARFPTLNDRFWQPGGNPDLKAEQSVGGAVGFSVPVWRNDITSWRWKTEAFFTFIEDMILWQPTNKFYWTPQNIGNVRTYGLISEQQFRWQKHHHSLLISQSYGFNRSGSIRAIVQNDKTVGKQLPYFPVHSFKTNLHYSWKTWKYGVDVQAYSRRFVTRDGGQQLDPYALVNIHAGYEKQLKSFHMEAKFSINNLFDQYYEEIVFRPMPTRNFLFTIIITWNHVQN